MIRKSKEYSKGFALIDVMMAALVLTVGCLAFLKLQQMSLQYAFNDYARSQGVAITQGFIEKLRGNRAFLTIGIHSGSITAGDNNLSSQLPQTTADCTASPPDSDCAKAILAYQRYLTSRQMKQLIKGKSILCYQMGSNVGLLRLTFMWLDNSSSKDAKIAGIQSTDCPTTFDAAVDSQFLANSVTIYAQL